MILGPQLLLSFPVPSEEPLDPALFDLHHVSSLTPILSLLQSHLMPFCSLNSSNFFLSDLSILHSSCSGPFPMEFYTDLLPYFIEVHQVISFNSSCLQSLKIYILIGDSRTHAASILFLIFLIYLPFVLFSPVPLLPSLILWQVHNLNKHHMTFAWSRL